MRKTSKKFIPIRYIKILSERLNLNFYLVSTNTILDLKNNDDDDILIYKKGLYRYLLPGKFINPLKNYFKVHTYINFNLNKDLINNYIINKDIILYNYNGYIFLNNLEIFRYTNKFLMVEFLYLVPSYKKFFCISLFFFIWD
jgi:hypothetical protein